MTSGKESPWNVCHFGPKLIENGQFCVELWYFLVLRWLTMVKHGVPWISMVYIEISRYTMKKPKSIITRLRILRFQWFVDQNDRNFIGILFQTSKGQNSFIFDEFWWFVWFFDLKNDLFFQRSKIRKSLGVPTESRPTPAEVPYGTIW